MMQRYPMNRGRGEPEIMEEDEEDDESDPQVTGQERALRSILRFLNNTIGEVKAEGPLYAFIAQHNREKPFHTFEFDRRDPLEQMAQEIIDVATNDISGLKRSQISYTLSLENHNGRATFCLNLPGGTSASSMEESLLVPNARGLVGQQMEHNQALMQMSVGSWQAQIKMLMALVQTKEERIQHLEDERARFFEAREKLLSEEAERDRLAKRQEREEERIDQVVGTIMTGIPAVVNKFVGKNLLVEKATPLEGLMTALASQLTQEQVQGLIQSGILAPNQMATFVEILKTIHDSFEKERKEQENGIASPTLAVTPTH